MPPQKFLKRVPRRPYDLHIDYQSWKAEIKEAWQDWRRAGQMHARKLHGDAYNPGRAFTGEVLDIIGPAPSPIDPVIAAEQGNKWVLGLTDRVDLRLAQFFQPEDLDPNYRDPDEPDYTGEPDLDDEFDTDDEDVETSRGGGAIAPKTDRNAEIARELEEGVPAKKVAKKHGISESRARAIGRRELARA